MIWYIYPIICIFVCVNISLGISWEPMINMPFTHLSKCEWNFFVFSSCVPGQLLASSEVVTFVFRAPCLWGIPLLLYSAQPENLYSAAWESCSLFSLSLTRFPVTLTPLMASSRSHSFYCLYWTLLRRKGIWPNSPLGATSDLIRYPARRFAFWKTTDKGPWWNYRHSGQPVGEGKDSEFQWSPLIIL